MADETKVVDTQQDGEGEETRGKGNGEKKQEDDNEIVESLCGKNGEWETRKISIMGVVKRFISQLSYGQELTRISMPSEFLNPYSILEVCALRYLGRFDSLTTANAQSSPAYRMLHVIHFFLSSLFRVKLYKKPYNPVVGESHYCFTEKAGKKNTLLGRAGYTPPSSERLLYGQ